MQKRVVDMNTENAQTKKKYTHEELHELGIAHEHSHEHSHDHPHDHDGEHSHEHGHGEHGHHHVHSEKEKKAVVNRLAKAIGHLEAKSVNMENHRISGGKRELLSILRVIKTKNLNIAFMVLIMFTFITKGMIGESTLCLSKL